jgi:hypothetical protein
LKKLAAGSLSPKKQTKSPKAGSITNIGQRPMKNKKPQSGQHHQHRATPYEKETKTKPKTVAKKP